MAPCDYECARSDRAGGLAPHGLMADTNREGRERWGIAPCFIVDDVVATANYYRDRLGFGYERFWGDPPSFCMVRRAGIIIMLAQMEQRGLMHPNGHEAWDAYVWVDDANALYEEFQSKGVTIARAICDQPYGCRDFDIEDCN